ncbi:MAG: hypothetical protein ACI9MR_001702 [Myxococcota bacterium]|jgi:hypothetical protein
MQIHRGKCVVFGLAVAMALGGCDTDEEAIAEGRPCVFCAGSVGSSAGCSGGSVGTCAAGLICATGFNQSLTCERPAVAGESCAGLPCADGLLCDDALECFAVADVGGSCGRLEHCAGDLICNYGIVPDAVGRGRCSGHAQDEGEPCYWAPRYAAGGDLWVSTPTDACAAGLSCVPSNGRAAYDPATGVTPETTPCKWFGACGHAGTCRRQPDLGRGAACLDDDACASGICTVSSPPAPAADGLPGFACDDGAACFLGEWPGLCRGVNDLPTTEKCFDATLGGDATAPCGPGLACIDERCLPHYSRGIGEACAPQYTWTEDPGPQPVCQPGSHCEGRCVLD